MQIGSTVQITKGTVSFKVRVESAVNYGSNEQPNWYIEGMRMDTGRPVYIKQVPDGVNISLVLNTTR